MATGWRGNVIEEGNVLKNAGDRENSFLYELTYTHNKLYIKYAHKSNI